MVSRGPRPIAYSHLVEKTLAVDAFRQFRQLTDQVADQPFGQDAQFLIGHSVRVGAANVEGTDQAVLKYTAQGEEVQVQGGRRQLAGSRRSAGSRHRE